MDIHIELQDTDARFSLFASSTYELAFGGLSVHMNADQFQQLCDNLRPWVVGATTPQPSADAVRELVKRILNWQPLTSINKADRLYQILIAAGIPFESVTDELESLLSAASGEKGVG